MLSSLMFWQRTPSECRNFNSCCVFCTLQIFVMSLYFVSLYLSLIFFFVQDRTYGKYCHVQISIPNNLNFCKGQVKDFAFTYFLLVSEYDF